MMDDGRWKMENVNVERLEGWRVEKLEGS